MLRCPHVSSKCRAAPSRYCATCGQTVELAYHTDGLFVRTSNKRSESCLTCRQLLSNVRVAKSRVVALKGVDHPNLCEWSSPLNAMAIN